MNSGATSLPYVIDSATCNSTLNNNKNRNSILNTIQRQSIDTIQTDEKKSKLHTQSSSIRLLNGSIKPISTLRNNPLTKDYSLMNSDECKGDTNSLLYKRMLSYSTNSLEPNVKQVTQDNSKCLNQLTVNSTNRFNNQNDNLKMDRDSSMIRMSPLNTVENVKKENLLSLKDKVNDVGNDMMRLIGNRKHSSSCLESCCSDKVNEMPKIPKIKLNKGQKLMQASLNNHKGASFLRKSSAFSKSLDSLCNLHLYESLELMNSKLNHRISRKRTLNYIFPNELNSKDEDKNFDISNDDLLNDLDDEIDDLNDDVDLSEFDLDLNDDFSNDLDDEIEFKYDKNYLDANRLNLDDQKQHTTKIVLKKQPKIRQQKPAKLVKDTIVKANLNDQANFLMKKNSFLSNYGSESSD